MVQKLISKAKIPKIRCQVLLSDSIEALNLSILYFHLNIQAR